MEMLRLSEIEKIKTDQQYIRKENKPIELEQKAK